MTAADSRAPSRMALLGSIWPRLVPAITKARTLGADWFAMSTAFDRTIDDRVVAHAGVLEIPMTIDGGATRAAGIHAVCTAPEFRGRGLARAAIEGAIEHAEAWADTIVLHAGDPALYSRFGFQAIDQWVWWTDVDNRPRAAPMRRLSAARPDDVAAVYGAFVGRLPVADALGIGEAAPLFVLDEVLGCDGFARLWVIDDLGVVVACDLEDRVLQIYDIVGPHWPPLDELLARAPGRVDRVEVFFVPERWPSVRWRVREGEPPDVLMARGRFTDRAIAMPPLARC
jgi:predicted N-acetyltransferase YhbS